MNEAVSFNKTGQLSPESSTNNKLNAKAVNAAS